MEFTKEELELGVGYLIINDLLEAFSNYPLTPKQIEHQQIVCLDEFVIYPETGDNIEEAIDLNSKIKFDLENLVKTGSGYGLGCYLYYLIVYLKDKIFEE